MAKPAYNALKKHIIDENDKAIGQGLVFVTDRKQARLRALDFVNFTLREDNDDQFVGTQGVQESEIKTFSETVLQTCLEKGIGFIHEGLTSREITEVKRLYSQKAI
jgi:replicative superfamily II helicase